MRHPAAARTGAAPSGSPLHLGRSAVLATVALALATAAHRLAGGGIPGPGRLGFLAAFTVSACLVLTLRRLRPTTLVASLAALELALHEGLTLLASDVAAHVVSVSHHHAHVTVPSGAGACGSTPLPMLMAHGAATVLTALALAHGEHVLWLLLAIVLPRVGARPRGQALPPRVAAAGCAPMPPARVYLVTGPLRGPPAPVRPA